jgi:excisionase family DNA binding protein
LAIATDIQDRVYTKPEAAQILKVHPNTLTGYINSGELRVVSLGWSVRIRREDLEEFMRRQMEQPRPPARRKGRQK